MGSSTSISCSWIIPIHPFNPHNSSAQGQHTAPAKEEQHVVKASPRDNNNQPGAQLSTARAGNQGRTAHSWFLLLSRHLPTGGNPSPQCSLLPGQQQGEKQSLSGKYGQRFPSNGKIQMDLPQSVRAPHRSCLHPPFPGNGCCVLWLCCCSLTCLDAPFFLGTAASRNEHSTELPLNSGDEKWQSGGTHCSQCTFNKQGHLGSALWNGLLWVICLYLAFYVAWILSVEQSWWMFLT